MSTPDAVEGRAPRSLSSMPPPGTARAVPFERGRLSAALRASGRLLWAAGLLGLFGGALVARLAVGLSYTAEARARASGELASLAMRALDDEVLEQVRARTGFEGHVGALRQMLTVRPVAPATLRFEARAASDEQARGLADALLRAVVEREHAARTRATAEAAQASTARREAAQAELDALVRARAEALAREGVTDPDIDAARVRARLVEIEGELQGARTRLTEAEARGSVYAEERRTEQSRQAAAELAEAQRALSVLLAERGERDPLVLAQRTRIKRLSSRVVTPESHAVGQRAEARAQAARERALGAERDQAVAELARLDQVASRLAPFTERLAQARLRAAAAAVDGPAVISPLAVSVSARAHVSAVSGKGLRALVSLLSPLLALLVVVLAIVVRELRGFRLCTTTELAHWLSAPVLAGSAWPAREEALESLVDTLSDGALEAPGTTLIVPMSEAERPLAHTLAARINGRAQRHFRSATGARIALAQAWEGDLTGPRLARAAEVADRVLWVVVADHYTGKELAERAALAGRRHGVAAVLLDAAMPLSRAVGDVPGFWLTRSASAAGASSIPPARVPLH